MAYERGIGESVAGSDKLDSNPKRSSEDCDDLVVFCGRLDCVNKSPEIRIGRSRFSTLVGGGETAIEKKIQKIILKRTS